MHHAAKIYSIQKGEQHRLLELMRAVKKHQLEGIVANALLANTAQVSAPPIE